MVPYPNYFNSASYHQLQHWQLYFVSFLAKYDVAISTACGGLDYILVETTAAAQACVDLLRRKNLGIATFMILVCTYLPCLDMFMYCISLFFPFEDRLHSHVSYLDFLSEKRKSHKFGFSLNIIYIFSKFWFYWDCLWLSVSLSLIEGVHNFEVMELTGLLKQCYCSFCYFEAWYFAWPYRT